MIAYSISQHGNDENLVLLFASDFQIRSEISVFYFINTYFISLNILQFYLFYKVTI